jgi:2-succinyl-5-enolpyruvyl-6-hydroxy-3-cyclohexene-1-carboxylate synthase
MSDNLHVEWARLVMRCFASAGVTELALCPGARSTPLALAAAEEPGLRVTPVIDERSAGFFALGQARATGRPTVVCTTSGSAGTHLFPAVVEAERARVPLITLTADRPWELSAAQANQSFDQHRLFGAHARAYLELGEPHAAALAHVPRVIAQTVLAALDPIPGAVQLNARFRKPLEPVADSGDQPWRAALAELLARGAPPTHPAVTRPSPAGLAGLADRFLASRRLLLWAGPAPCSRDPRGTQRRLRQILSRMLSDGGSVLVAEATSGALYGRELDGLVFDAPDAWLTEALAGGDKPDLVIQLGAPPTSAAFAAACERWNGVPRVIVSPESIPDPTGGAAEIVLGEATDVLERLAWLGSEREPDRAWRDRAAELATRARAALAAHCAPGEWSEPALHRALVSALPERAWLVVGNSLPVRDLDAFGGRSSAEIVVLHQRGLSGIDGLIAGACGTRSAVPESEPVIAVLGDVSALHDVGSLALAARCSAPLVLVVIDNGGGRIFGELPVARAVSDAVLERYFVQPPSVAWEHLARAFGVRHRRVETTDAFENALAEALGAEGATLVHASVPAEAGARARKPLRAGAVGRS